MEKSDLAIEKIDYAVRDLIVSKNITQLKLTRGKLNAILKDIDIFLESPKILPNQLILQHE